MQSQGNKRLWAAAVLFVVIALVGLVLALGPHSKKSPDSSGRYTDPLSHETVSDPEGKAPDTYGQPSNTPLYLGFDKLLNYGIDKGQLDNIKTAFYRYSVQQPSPIKQISIDVDHITNNPDASNPNASFIIDFNAQFDRSKLYKSRVEYQGLDDVRLYLMNSEGSTVYDSGILYASGGGSE
jgi:hypothetical protein